MISTALDSVADRWRMLEPHVKVFGPDDGLPRPAVILFHGCAGVRPHIETYAERAAEAGYRAFMVDSYAPRGWSLGWAVTFVCSGARFWGRERAGDVLAAVWGIALRSDVKSDSLSLAGWSHGSWSIMDLMTMPLTQPGEAGLQDADPGCLDGVRSMFLAYPYGGPGALSRSKPWVRGAETLGIVCERDHITGQADALRVFDASKHSETSIQLWIAAGTHAFDAPGHEGFPSPMRYDSDLAGESLDRFEHFIRRTLGGPGADFMVPGARVANDGEPFEGRLEA